MRIVFQGLISVGENEFKHDLHSAFVIFRYFALIGLDAPEEGHKALYLFLGKMRGKLVPNI